MNSFFFNRMKRERQTLDAMLRLYCRKHHGAEELCVDCRELSDYSRKRLAHCPFQGGKTSCGQCEVHCYNSAMRERIRYVMREIGPTMLWSHPLMALAHLFDGLRKKPLK
ncbi:MAG: nitrous oxide-stimulated promoter family protein [Spirochaetales bacterium]|nr:nitrous oxide-stimulated promoter family protein [Spirochaetales bacterium]